MVTSHLGLVLSPLEVTAVRAADSAGRELVFRAALDPFAGDSAQWPSLALALRDLATKAGPAALSIALMPPLAEVRALELPALREDELRSLVTRNASRYFVGARGSQLVAVSGRRKRGPGEPAIAATVSMRLIAAVHSAARDAGFTVGAIVPAESAWAAAARALWPAFAQRTGHVIVLLADRTDVVHLRDGAVDGVRRFRAGAVDASRIAEVIHASSARAGQAPARVGAVGSTEFRKEITRALSAAGISVNGPSAHFMEVAEYPDRLAAMHAASSTDLVFRTDDARSDVQARAKRMAMIIGAAAALLLVLAGGAEMWGIRRQLAQVQAERAALKPQLANTLVGRTSIETAYRQLGVINAAERTAPQWTSALVHLAGTLNDDAYLTAFRGRGDSIVVEGIADHAASVFTDLEKTPGLSRVGAAAPVRREAPGGATPTERFTIAAHLDEAALRPVARVAR